MLNILSYDIFSKTIKENCRYPLQQLFVERFLYDIAVCSLVHQYFNADNPAMSCWCVMCLHSRWKTLRVSLWPKCYAWKKVRYISIS